jgi:hypothetical protein
MMISEANYFSERVAVVPRGFDADHFADCRKRTFGFDHQPDHLDNTAARFRDARLSHAMQSGA